MSRLSTSSWSLHRNLGPMYRPADDDAGRLLPHDTKPGALSLLELPAKLAARGINTLEVCHFHFPSTDPAYLLDLRVALEQAGVELYSVLIDAGDITAPDAPKREADFQWIAGWLEIAGKCGAAGARIIAGNSEADERGEAVRLSASGLRRLAAIGQEHGVQVFTENFRALTRRPQPLLEILDACEGEVGLCADFGNFSGPTKYDDLAAILPCATSVHAKAHYPAPGQMEREDFVHCMELASTSGFDGPYSLIFDGAGDEWDSLAEIQAVVEEYL